MHPAIHQQMAIEHMKLLRREAAAYRRARAASYHPPQPVRTAIQLRLSSGREELDRLAALSERPAPSGDWLVADLDGVPVAAVSIEHGATVYDPFRPTSAAVSLLKLRRKQVLAAA